jgi:hypothetical protein
MLAFFNCLSISHLSGRRPRAVDPFKEPDSKEPRADAIKPETTEGISDPFANSSNVGVRTKHRERLVACIRLSLWRKAQTQSL